MRQKHPWGTSVLLAIALCLPLANAAKAQTFLQTLFGNLFKSAPQSGGRHSSQSIILSPRNGDYGYGARSRFYYYDFGSGYRTMCVRACDGYYFPISPSTPPGRFHKDAESCETRCPGATLYYLPKQSDEVAEMVDLTGRRYDELTNAFVYRKKLIDGCACRQMPWSAIERARHKRYAYQEEILRLAEEREKRLRTAALLEGDGKMINAYDAAPGAGEDRLNSTAAGGGPDMEYVAAIRAALAGSGQDRTAEATSGRLANSAKFSASPAAARRPWSSPHRRHMRKTKRLSSPAFGWPLSGGALFAWPGGP
jgi:Protein of unknown function (DUF2865)